MKKILHMGVLAGSLAFCGTTFAAVAVQGNVAAGSVATVEQGRQGQMFTGVVKQEKSTPLLITQDATYTLAGGDFTNFIGKMVNVSGTVIKEGGVKKLVVADLKLAR